MYRITSSPKGAQAWAFRRLPATTHTVARLGSTHGSFTGMGGGGATPCGRFPPAICRLWLQPRCGCYLGQPVAQGIRRGPGWIDGLAHPDGCTPIRSPFQGKEVKAGPRPCTPLHSAFHPSLLE